LFISTSSTVRSSQERLELRRFPIDKQVLQSLCLGNPWDLRPLWGISFGSDLDLKPLEKMAILIFESLRPTAGQGPTHGERGRRKRKPKKSKKEEPDSGAMGSWGLLLLLLLLFWLLLWCAAEVYVGAARLGRLEVMLGPSRGQVADMLGHLERWWGYDGAVLDPMLGQFGGMLGCLGKVGPS